MSSSPAETLAVHIAVALKQVPAEQRKRLGHPDWMVAELAGKLIATAVAKAVCRSFEIEHKPMPVAASRSHGEI